MHSTFHDCLLARRLIALASVWGLAFSVAGLRNSDCVALGAKKLASKGIWVNGSSDGLGEEFETLNLGVKPYPSCRYSHAAIDGLIELKKELKFSSDDLDDIDIGLSETALNIIGYPLTDKQHPKSVVDGQFSMPFCAAVTVKSGGLQWDDYKNHLNMDF